MTATMAYSRVRSAVCMLLGLCMLGVAEVHAATRVTEVEGIAEYRLDNGMRILLAPDNSQPATTVNVTYLVGSRHEGAGEAGMAHLLEHLVFKGTPGIPHLYLELTRRGMRSNGSTWFDRTNYFETFAASPENLEWALRMEADRMVNAFIARKDLDSEMTVVRNEMERGENGESRMLGQLVMATAYRWHAYGRDTIGARSDVENVSIDSLQAFYRKYYQPDNAVLVVAGRFEPAQALQWAERYFGAIARPARALSQPYTVEPAQEGERRVELARIGENRHLAVLYHVPPAMHADYAALEVLQRILDATPGGRLHDALVKSGLATEVWAWMLPTYDPGFIMFGAQLRKEGDPAASSRILLQQIEEMAARPIDEAELSRARKSLRAGMDTLLADPSRFGIALSQSIAVGDWRHYFWLREQVAHVTAQDVTRVAQRYLRPANRTLGEFLPQDGSTPVRVDGRQDLGAAMAALPAQSSLVTGEEFDPDPAAIEARTRRTRLDNGLQIALLPKKTRGERVRLNFSMRLGNADSMSGQGMLSGALGSLLLAGTQEHDRTQIAALAESLETRIATASSGQTVSVTVDTRRPHLAAALSLLREVLRESRFPPDELQRSLRQRIGASRAAELEPDSVAARALARHLTPYSVQDPRYAPDAKEFEARARGIDSAAMLAFWQAFAGADHAWMSVVGDFDPDAVERSLREHFGDWRSARPYAALPEVWPDAPAISQVIELRDKQNASLKGGRRIPVGERNPDYPAVIVATHLLGGGFLHSRLATRLRQQEGLSYNVAASYSGSATLDHGTLSLSAIYAPQVRARVERAVREELQRVAREGFTAEELDAARTALLQTARVMRAADANLAATLTRNLRIKRDFRYDIEFEKALATLNLAQLNEVARKYFDPAGISLVFAGSFDATREQARSPHAEGDVPGAANQ